MKFIKKILLFVFMIILLPAGLSSWELDSISSTENNVGSDIGDTVTITLHNKQSTTETSTTTKYYIPGTNSGDVTVTHNILPKDANDKINYQKWGEVGSRWETIEYDEIQQYYDVVNGVYTPIDQHNASYGPDKIKSVNITVNNWQETTDASNFGDVWKVGFNNYYFRFYTNCEDQFEYVNKYSIGDDYKSEYLLSSETVTDENAGTITTTQIYERIRVYDILDQKRGRQGFFFYVYYMYGYFYPVYQRRMVVTTQIIPHSSYNDVETTLKVKKGSLITPFELGIENYTQYGYYSSADYSSFYDFTKPINENTDLYLRYIDNNSDSNLLTSKINSLSSTSNSTLNIYDSYNGGTNGDYDVFADPIYDSNTESIFINKATISNGCTVNMTFGESKTYIGDDINELTGNFTSTAGNHRSSDSTIATEYESTTNIGIEKRSLYIILNDDLTINGNLTIGAEVGGYSNYSFFSYIIGRYAELDLHGNNLYVDGGTLLCLGKITDSIGGGRIYVTNGGKVTATMTIDGVSATRASIVATSKRQSPFFDYRFAYIFVPIDFSYNTTFEAYIKYDLSTYGIANLYFSIIGSSNSLFYWDANYSSSSFSYEPYIIDSVSASNTTFLQKYYQYRQKFIFNGYFIETESLEFPINLTLSAVSVDAVIDLIRLDIPISPYFDFIVTNGSTLELDSKLVFYPGSTLYVDSKGKIIFSHAGTKQYREYGQSALGVEVIVCGETRYLAGGILNYNSRICDEANSTYAYTYNRFSKGVLAVAAYWNYIKINNINILGEIEIDNSIITNVSTGDGFYLFSGNINFSNNSLITLIKNKNYLKTYDFKSELVNGFLYSGDTQGIKEQYNYASYYHISPLISGNKAFILDSKWAWIGTYEKTSGIFKKEGNIDTSTNEIVISKDEKQFFLEVDTDMYEDGSSGSNQSSRIDRTITISSVDYSNETYKIIRSNNKYFVLYLGLYIPINSSSSVSDESTFSNGDTISVNAQKFFSNKDSSQISDDFSNMIIKFVSSTNKWAYSSFWKL